MGHAPKMRYPQALQFVEAWMGRSAPKGALRGPLQEAPRFLCGLVRQLHDVPALICEGGHDEAHPWGGRQVELQAHLDGLSYRISHTGHMIRLGERRHTSAIISCPVWSRCSLLEVRRINLPRTPVNRRKVGLYTRGRSASMEEVERG